jgi:hypothetical protein
VTRPAITPAPGWPLTRALILACLPGAVLLGVLIWSLR